MMKNFPVICMLATALLLNACSDDGLSREDEVKRFIESAVEAVEGRDLSAMTDLIHAGYRDRSGYNKKQVSNLLRLSFIRNKNIYLLTKIDDIEFLTDNEALVKLHVAMAGTAITDANAVSALRARIYKFELHLIKQDEWLLQQAKWHPASLTDMQ